MTTTTAQTAPAPGALRSQELFEAMTSPDHKVDTRTPADLGYHVSPSAAERATWRKVAA